LNRLTKILNALSQPVSPLALALIGFGCLVAAAGTLQWLRTAALAQDTLIHPLQLTYAQVEAMEADLVGLKMQREKDLATLKDGMLGVGKSRKDLYESSLQIQEEKRLLEKQWDILITTIKFDEDSQRVQVLKSDVPVANYQAHFSSSPTIDMKKLPGTVRITSKERFAHPERGKAEKVNGLLVWTPPQVGLSVRSNALGEYVMFTECGLIFHGPSPKAEEHSAYPHICLGLSLNSAKELYQQTYIGTKVILSVTR
jgi:hypothetical protein